LLDDDEYIRSNVIDSVSQSGGLVVLQLVRRNDGLFDVFTAKRGRLPEVTHEALPVEQARDVWSEILLEMFRRMTDDQDEVPDLVAGRIRSLMPPES
jgi:hypothetical protein